MRISFLSSPYKKSAVKTFTAEGVLSYPRIKLWNSTSYTLDNTLDGLRQKTRLMREHAARGECMVKGFLTRELKQESRSNAVDRTALTNTLLLDIDGIEIPGTIITLPLDRHDITQLAEHIIDALPECFKDVSYIVHASSSLGVKGNRICLHLDFLLQHNVPPALLKEYIVGLNHRVPIFKQNFQLSATGSALRFPLDRTVADNSHLIYLGTPIFKDGLNDPIPNPDDRIFLIEKPSPWAELPEDFEQHTDPSKNHKANELLIRALRSAQGLPPLKPNTQITTINGRATSVVTNPTSCKMRFANDNGHFVAYNVNDGDSAGYYVVKHAPQIVYNFKGEPNFLFEAADPDTYYWHLDQFIKTDTLPEAEKVPSTPIVFRDFETNTYYNALVNIATGSVVEIAKTGREALPDYMAQYGGVMPDNIPVWRLAFDPLRGETISFKDRFLNKFIPSPYMKGNVEMPDDYTPFDYHSGYLLDKYCPTIAEIIFHVVGRDMECYLHFLNWLATAFQTRDKTMTAWILQGTQGTGKGTLFDYILKPLVGHGLSQSQPFAVKIRVENIEDQFNNWVECALFVAFDEFRIEDSSKSKRLFNKIKSMITEPTEPIRGMRENLREVRTYANYLFFSNDKDVIFIPEDDRRFNVAPRQETKLTHIFPDTDWLIHTAIPQELPVFAQVLHDYQYDAIQTRTVLDNGAKRKMRSISNTTIDDFINAIKQGDLDYFLPILDLTPAMSNNYLTPARLIVKTIIRDAIDKVVHRITVDEVRVLYCVTIGISDSPLKFAKLLARHGLESKRFKVNKVFKTGFEIHWGISDNEAEHLRKMYLNDVDRTFGDDPKIAVLRAPD